MSRVIRYKVYCDTDAKWEYVWKHEDDPAPSVCPANATHTIDVDSVVIIEEVSSQAVETTQLMPEGGKKKSDRGFHFDAAAGVDTIHDYIVTEDLQIKGGLLECSDNHVQDSVSMEIVDYQFLYAGAWYAATPTLAGIPNVEGLTWAQVSPNGVSLHHYLKNFPVSKIGTTKIKNDAITTTPLNGLKIRLTYHSKGNVLVPCNVGIVAYTE